MELNKRLVFTALKHLIFIFMVMSLAACGSIPGSGPTAGKIENLAESDGVANYMLVELNNQAVSILSAYSSKTLSERFTSKHTHNHRQTIGVGDVLNITVFESGNGGLFSGESGSRSANFPAIGVSESGQISLPYAGVINVDGDTPLRVQNKIVARLRGQAIEPQVLVAIANNNSNAVIVGGDVRSPGRVPLQLGETTLLDVIALAGGTNNPTHETFVTFIRGKTKGRQLLHTIIDAKGENIKVNAGDRIILRHEPETFVVLGAVNRPGNYPLLSTETNLLEAFASASGFENERANKRGMFVFRQEPRHVAEQLGTVPADLSGSTIPVVYQLKITNPVSYFVAKEFIVRNKDAVFTADSNFVNVRKFLQLLSTVTAPGVQAVSTTANL
ncbi:MAG: polysaccharide biosynthesis/export family protein [Hyphomicrobiales bacterium]